MTRPTTNWFKAGRLFAWIAIGSLVATVFTFFLVVMSPGSQMADASTGAALPALLPLYALLVSIGALIVSTVGTASAVILGWRNERRQSAESKLKIEQLELQLAEARKQSNSAIGGRVVKQ